MDVQIQVKYMDRSSSTIAVLGLLLIGIAVCLKQTIEFYDAIGASLSSVFLTAEALLAVIVLGAGVVLFRRKFLRRPGFTGQDVSKLLLTYAGYSQPFGLRSFAADDRDRRLCDSEFLRDQADQFGVCGSIDRR